MDDVPSLYFEEFKQGDQFFSPVRIITEEDIKDFAGLSGDFNPIHTDPEYAEKSIYGKRVAHGLLGLSLSSGLAASLGFAKKTTLAFRSLEWKFNGPIFIGDTIRAEFKVERRRSLPGGEGGLIVFKITVFNQDDQIVQSGKWALVIKCRGEQGA